MPDRGEGTIVERPIRLDYDYTAGQAQSRFLKGMAQGKILGEKCPVCGKVYVPPRGSCPTDGVPTRDQVDLPHKGTLTSFCIVNVQFYGQAMEVPYTSGLIKLDGASSQLTDNAGISIGTGTMTAVTFYPFPQPFLRLTLQSMQWKGDRALELAARGQF